MTEPGRIMGLDVGTRRIGVAVSAPVGSIALPVTTIQHTTDASVVAALRALIEQYAIQRIIVGLPLNLKGEDTQQTLLTRSWSETYLTPLHIPFEFFDERLSTQQAMRQIHDSGGHDTQKLHRDAMAAQIILQTYLDLPRAGKVPL